jgi:integrase/recombinase XerD
MNDWFVWCSRLMSAVMMSYMTSTIESMAGKIVFTAMAQSQQKVKAYLEIEETVKLEDAATCLRDRLLIRLLARLGCRVSEALTLAVEDVDFEHGTVRIEHLKSRIRLVCTGCNARLGKSHSFCPKCGKMVDKTVIEEKHRRRMRTLPIDHETLNLLWEYVSRGGAITRGSKKLLFGINRHRAWQIVKECAERAGLPRLLSPETGREHGVSPHRLRDAFAVHAMRIDDSGDGLRLLQEQLGHASFNTTARYRKVAGGELKEWYESLWRKGVKPGGT